MEKLDYKNENIGREHFKNILKNQFLKVKNSLLRSEKDFIELKERELKDRKVKIEREIEELFFKPISVSIDDMDWLEKRK